MSLETSVLQTKSKGERIVEEVEARLSPAARDRFRVYVAKEKRGLTRIRIVRRISERADGGTSVDPD